MNRTSEQARLLLPQRQIGMVAPLRVTSEIAYQFYRLQAEMGSGWNSSLAEASMDLRAFTRPALKEAEERFDSAVESLVHKGVEFLVLSGVPIVVLASWSYWKDRLETLGKQYDLPFVSDFECSLAAFESLGARRIAIADKWTQDMNDQLVSDIEGNSRLEVVGLGTDEQDARRVSGTRPEPGIESCRIACRRALDASAHAPDALFLAGGAWYSTLATAALEQEFGLPIVTNPGASMWYALNKVDCFTSVPSFGALYGLHLED